MGDRHGLLVYQLGSVAVSFGTMTGGNLYSETTTPPVITYSPDNLLCPTPDHNPVAVGFALPRSTLPARRPRISGQNFDDASGREPVTIPGSRSYMDEGS